MSVQLFASIYIGTYDVSMKIFEFLEKRRPHEVDSFEARLDLARNSFETGHIDSDHVQQLCDQLAEFKEIMAGYKITEYEAYAAASLRDLPNEEFVINQIFIRTGIMVKVLSNSEHRFITFQAIAGRNTFERMIQTSAIIADVGGASMQITIFREGRLVTTQHIEVGTMQLSSLFGERGQSLRQYEKQIEEYVNKKLERFRTMYMTESVDSIILISDYGIELVGKIGGNGKEERLVKSEKFVKFIDKLRKKTLEEITGELNLPNNREPLIIPSIMVFRTLVDYISPKEVWVPGAGIEDGMACDYAYRKKILKSSHNFDADVISAAKYLAEHYKSYTPHTDALRTLSTRIFDTLKKVHGLGKRERLLLEVASILQDCGKYVSLFNSAQSARQIILSSEFIGLSHEERTIVAMTVYFNGVPLEEYDEVADELDTDAYLTVAKLAAIMRVGNALEQSRKEKFKNIRMAVKDHDFVITVEAFDDISLEKALFESRTACFEDVYSLKPVLREKRVFNYESEN
ncbi:MAG: phosphatase [Clostridiales bacterium]|nr:phosphatase [Clostridiales bacterium]